MRDTARGRTWVDDSTRAPSLSCLFESKDLFIFQGRVRVTLHSDDRSIAPSDGLIALFRKEKRQLSKVEHRTTPHLFRS